MTDKSNTFIPILSGRSEKLDTELPAGRGGVVQSGLVASSERDAVRTRQTLEQRLEEVLRWAELHTELANALLKEHSIAPQDALSEQFIDSLRDGVALLGRGSVSESASGRQFGMAHTAAPSGCSTPVAPSSRNAVLPLSGSSRFGDVGLSRSRGFEELVSLRRSVASTVSSVSLRDRAPLNQGFSPSRSYCKKKS